MNKNFSDKNLIFLISQPRSGSTLLQKLLSAHTQISTMSEPWLALYPLYQFKEEGIQAEFDFRLYKIALGEAINKIQSNGDNFKELLYQYLLKVYSTLIDNSTQYFLDKTPRYYLILDELLELFPNSKFILLRRNPLSVLASIIKTWRETNYQNDLHDFYYDIHIAPNIFLKYIKRREKYANIKHVKYEDIVSNPKSTLKNLQRFLELPIENITHYDSSKQWRFGDQTNVYKNNTPSNQMIDKWKDGLDDPQYWNLLNDYLEELGEKTINTFGYDYQNLRLILNKNKPKSLRGVRSLATVTNIKSVLKIRLENQKNDLHSQKIMIEKLNNQLSDKQLQIKDLQKQANSHLNNIEQLKKRLDSRDKTIENLTSQVSILQDNVKKLNNQILHLNEELFQILNSKSWIFISKIRNIYTKVKNKLRLGSDYPN